MSLASLMHSLLITSSSGSFFDVEVPPLTLLRCCHIYLVSLELQIQLVKELRLDCLISCIDTSFNFPIAKTFAFVS